jgi:hypothetical protein
MAQEHLAVANVCMLRRVTSREAWLRSFVPPDDNLRLFERLLKYGLRVGIRHQR